MASAVKLGPNWAHLASLPSWTQPGDALEPLVTRLTRDPRERLPRRRTKPRLGGGGTGVDSCGREELVFGGVSELQKETRSSDPAGEKLSASTTPVDPSSGVSLVEPLDVLGEMTSTACMMTSGTCSLSPSRTEESNSTTGNR